jgi:SagB-type dehydrogenase family enzyme
MIISGLLIVLALGFLMQVRQMRDVAKEADTLRSEGRFAEAAQILADFMRENGPHMTGAYEAACYFALAGDMDNAFKYLQMSLDNGWSDAHWLQADTDLESLRNDPRWQTCVQAATETREKLLASLPEKHPDVEPIALPEPDLTGAMTVEQAMYRRRSHRAFSDTPLTLAQASQLLWAAYGVTKVFVPEKLRGGFKTAPSAGARYPLEVYLAAWHVDGLEPGYYRYEPDGHKLFPVRPGDLHKEFGEACNGQPYASGAPASIVWSAVFERNTSRYGQRGRALYVPMDTGHSAQNVCLQAEALGLGAVEIGAFDDLKLCLTLRLTREEEPLYVVPVGYKQ